MNKTCQGAKRLLVAVDKLSCRRYYSYKFVRRPDISSERKPIVSQGQSWGSAISLSKHIKARILVTGPITVADYMREVLTHPQAGYYMHRDVFGKEGDFITSPEISQIFGELVSIWVLSEWRKIGCPTPFQIVELGPGRGTLARDMLKVLTKFHLGGQFSMHLVEISPHLSNVQAQRFCFNQKQHENDSLPYYQTAETGSGTKVYWYKHLDDVPQEFSIVLAHEFFDALPVHKLQLDEGVWKEVLIDVQEADDAEFRFVLSKAETPISRVYRPIDGETRKCLEYSLETDRVMGMLEKRFERDGGFGLIMDYGHFGEKSDTFRAFKSHKLHDPLKDPGTADLTADVDFRQLKRAVEQNGNVFCLGPVEQGAFLKKMEGEARLEQLLQNALPENKEIIKSGYDMLTDPHKMGTRFKFFSIFPAVLKDHLIKFPVHGFH